MRVAVDVLRVKPDEVEQLFDPLGSLATRYSVRMDSERFTDDVPHRHTRIQRGIRVLKDDLNVTTQFAHRRSREIRHVASLEGDRARRRRLEVYQQTPQRGLAAPRLSDDTECLARIEVETDPVDSLDVADGMAHHAGFERVMLGEVTYRQNGFSFVGCGLNGHDGGPPRCGGRRPSVRARLRRTGERRRRGIPR